MSGRPGDSQDRQRAGVGASGRISVTTSVIDPGPCAPIFAPHRRGTVAVLKPFIQGGVGAP